MLSRRCIGLLAILALVGCGNSGPPVKIVVPHDLRGEFLIIETPEGHDIPRQGGQYVRAIPKSGRLLVKSLAPFKRFHTESIVFDDGTVPEKFDHPAHAKNDEFTVYYGSSGSSSDDPRPRIYFFIGTAKEASRAEFR